MTRKTSAWLTLAGLLITTLALTGCDGSDVWTAVATEDFSYETTAEEIANVRTLRVNAPAGDITVRYDINYTTALITGTKSASGATTADAEARLTEVIANLDIPENSTLMILSVTLPESTNLLATPDHVDFDVTLPWGVDMELTTTSGKILVYSQENCPGNIMATSGAGPIGIYDNWGDLDILSDAGLIDADYCTGDFIVRGAGSKITLTNMLGGMEVWNELRDIAITMPRTAQVSIDLWPKDGAIDCELDGFFDVDNYDEDDHRIRADLNGGGPLVRATSENGDVHFDSIPSGDDDDKRIERSMTPSSIAPRPTQIIPTPALKKTF